MQTQDSDSGNAQADPNLVGSTMSDVCFITKAFSGVLKSWGERPFIFRAGPHNPHGPYFYCAEKLSSDDEISVVR